MTRHFIEWIKWVGKKPIALINLFGLTVIIVGGGSVFYHLLTKPIDVLQDWEISTTLQPINGNLPIYSPGGTLEFVSASNKLTSAEGVTTRVFDCDAIDTAQAREIQLPPLPANRAPGFNAPRENAIVVPAVNEFNGLPRTCRLIINVCYQDVILWRDHCETARSNDFLVAEKKINAEEIRRQIDDLNKRIEQLEAQLIAESSQ